MMKPAFPSDIAFSAAVKAIQSAKGSRPMLEKMELTHGFRTKVDDELSQFVEQQRSLFLATASADGQPYIQHRGGPPGFLRVLGPTTLGFADYRGNRHYISEGNLSENAKAQLFLIDYMHQRRIKIWGKARVIADDPEMLARLMPESYRAKAEQAILFEIAAWDVNCPQHIPQRFDAEDVARALQARDERIAELEAEIAQLRA